MAAVAAAARRAWGAAAVALGALLAASALLAGTPAGAGSSVTPGLAAGGIRLGADVRQVERLLGPPSSEIQDPTNPRIIIQRWEALCLGARYTRAGALLAIDAWTDLGQHCPGAAASYVVEGRAGRRVSFRSTRADVTRAFGTAPDRVLHGGTFTVLVYDDAGIAFYIRDDGDRAGLVDSLTVFPRGASRTVWAPGAWGGE